MEVLLTLQWGHDVSATICEENELTRSYSSEKTVSYMSAEKGWIADSETSSWAICGETTLVYLSWL